MNHGRIGIGPQEWHPENYLFGYFPIDILFFLLYPEKYFVKGKTFISANR